MDFHSNERRLIRGNLDRWLCREQIPPSFCQLIRSALENATPKGDVQFHDLWRFDRGELLGLDLSQWRPYPEIFLDIVHSPGMQAIAHLDCQLTSLCLEGTRIGATAAQALASSASLKNLRYLNVACTC